ncbi:heparan sulfate glucosamine 3-O-sulfotransferase 1-like [Symsagittifera roscoffensis]|uniref:heparan sulfate glucosamine 3-O-sulfotransferase 1-like n=1 Tax=Symsagittifera roscoffensis TaxID=84072 RepID=UPI00307C92CF
MSLGTLKRFIFIAIVLLFIATIYRVFNKKHQEKINYKLLIDLSNYQEPVIKNNSPQKFEYTQKKINSSYKKTQKYPTAIVIGAQKCGTTALMKFLSFHSSISAQMTEQQFFNRDKNFENGTNYEIYRKSMMYSKPFQISIEKTPNYLAHKLAPERILDYQNYLRKKLRFILIARDPIRRAISGVYHQVINKGLNLTNLTETLLKPENGFVDFSFYGFHLQRWLGFFSIDQFLILNGDEFAKNNPVTALKKVEDFLDIPHEFKAENFGFLPKKLGYYCYLPTSYCFPDDRGHSGYPEKLTEEGKKELKRVFEPDLKLFHKLTGVAIKIAELILRF